MAGILIYNAPRMAMRIIPFDELVRRYFSGEAFVVIDTETTGLNTFHDDIIEVAGLIWQKGAEPITFQELIQVNPNKITPAAWEIHQIPLEEIQSARLAADVFTDFMAFAGDRSIIAHNAKFDFNFLNSNLIRAGLTPYQNDFVACTYTYAKEQQRPGKLSELAVHYGVAVESNNLHRALYDVNVLTGVLNKMMKENEPEDMQYSLIF